MTTSEGFPDLLWTWEHFGCTIVTVSKATFAEFTIITNFKYRERYAPQRGNPNRQWVPTGDMIGYE